MIDASERSTLPQRWCATIARRRFVGNPALAAPIGQQPKEAMVHDDIHSNSISRPAEGPHAWTYPRLTAAASTAMPTAARFALSSPTLPPLTKALAVGERVRMALLRCSDGHLVFAGRDAAGRVARSEQRHEHAWFLPADDDADGSLDHVVVCAHAGFDSAALRALVDLRRVWGHGGAVLELTLVGLGSPRTLGGLRGAIPRRDMAPQLGTARVWESLTPFVPPRRTKVRTSSVRDAPDEQVSRLLALHGFPAARVEPLAPDAVTPPRPLSPIDWSCFRRLRSFGDGSRGANAAFGFRLRFDQPVTGPIALGYAAHQGLGQFVAVE
jgi:CRISPR-associated protein Csb2